MNAETFAEWLRLRGYNVVRTASSYWYEASPRVYQAFPYNWLIKPSEAELNNFMRDYGVIALRYSAPLGSAPGSISYHTVYEKQSYSIDDLDRRTRQNVRKGLKNCSVEPVPLERLADEAWYLEVDTTERQSRHMTLTEDLWCRCYRSANELPGFEGWGALVDGKLVASLLSFQLDDCCVLISQQCDRAYMDQRVNNALCFEVTRTMVARPEIRCIFYSLCSLDAPPSVDVFKFRMGYTSKPVCERVVFHPFVKPFVQPAMHSAVDWMRQRYPSSHFLAKADGMLRVYLDGKQPLSEQVWPECLSDRKTKLLQNLSYEQEIQEGSMGTAASVPR